MAVILLQKMGVGGFVDYSLICSLFRQIVRFLIQMAVLRKFYVCIFKEISQEMTFI